MDYEKMYDDLLNEYNEVKAEIQGLEEELEKYKDFVENLKLEIRWL